MWPQGKIALLASLILLLGHVIIFFVTMFNSSISPSVKSEIISIIAPITGVVLFGASSYACQIKNIPLSSTQNVNSLFVIFALVLPLFALIGLIWMVLSLDGRASFDSIRNWIVAAEVLFGAAFAKTMEELFSHKDVSNSNQT